MRLTLGPRHDREGDAGLQDRSSRPHHSPTRHDAATQARVLTARAKQRCHPVGLAITTGIAARSVSRILARHGVAPLDACDPITGRPIRATRASTHRYEHHTTGELVHVDVKKLGRIPDGAAGGPRPRPSATRRIGFDYIHAMVDGHSRFAYAEVLHEQRGTTCAAFVARAVAVFAAAGSRIE